MKTVLMEIILRLKLNIIEIKTKDLCFGYFCRFKSSALTSTPRNTYVYVFGTLFGFCNF